MAAIIKRLQGKDFVISPNKIQYLFFSPKINDLKKKKKINGKEELELLVMEEEEKGRLRDERREEEQKHEIRKLSKGKEERWKEGKNSKINKHT